MNLLSSSFGQCSRFPIDFHVTGVESKWECLAEQYDNWLHRHQSPPKLGEIPKYIHQIWIGGQIPSKYLSWCNSWQLKNPSYKYKLWTDNDIVFRSETLRKIFVETSNIGAKSDILRYEIIDRFGGVYCDTDLECIKPLDDLIESTSFATCSLFSDEPHFGNGFIAACPSHPILSDILENIIKPIKTDDTLQIIDTIGPGFFTDIILAFLGSSSADSSLALLPSNYFYPWPNYLRTDHVNVKKYVSPCSYAIHYWEMSWAKESSPLKSVMVRVVSLLSKLKIHVKSSIRQATDSH